MTNSQTLSADKIPKPQAYDDGYDYLLETLENGLRLLVISGPEKVDKGGCAIGMNVGWCSDPVDRQGLAHFAEHLLFMGSKKYPDEAEFSKYIAESGGSSNAFTSNDMTIYYAVVKPLEVKTTVDRMAQFFIAPLFTKSAIDREVEAVNSEYLKGCQSDSFKSFMLERTLAHPDHPIVKCNCGCNETLRQLPMETCDETGPKGTTPPIDKADHDAKVEELRNALVKFHSEHYSSTQMSAVVLCAEPAADMMKYCKEIFSQVPKKDVKVAFGPEIGGDIQPFGKEHFQKCIYQQPVRDAVKSVNFSFTIDDQWNDYETLSAGYVSYILGHEGPGSLAALLLNMGYATGLNAGAAWSNLSRTLFKVGVDVTELGLKNIKRIGELLIGMIRILKEKGVDEEAVKEWQALNEQQWRFSPMANPFSLLPDTCSNLLPLPGRAAETVFETFSRCKKIDLKKIGSICEQFLNGGRENFGPLGTMNVTIIIRDPKNFPCPLKTKFYDVSHNIKSLDEQDPEWLKSWTAIAAAPSLDEAVALLKLPNPQALHMPKRNPYMPRLLDLKPGGRPWTEAPEKIEISPKNVIFYHQDGYFKLPHVELSIRVESPDVLPQSYKTTGEWVDAWTRQALYTYAIQESLNEEIYDATVAGLDYSLTLSPPGSSAVAALELTVAGFDEKASVLLDRVLERMLDPTNKGSKDDTTRVSRRHIEVAHESRLRNLKNSLSSAAPYSRASADLSEIALDGVRPLQLFINSLEKMDLDSFEKNLDKCLLKGSRIDTIVSGNVNKEDMERYKSGLKKLAERLGVDSEESVNKDSKKDTTATAATSFLRSHCIDFTKQKKEMIHFRMESANDTETNCAVKLQLTLPSCAPEDAAALRVFEQWLSNEFFNQLRTQQALGYVVFAGLSAEADRLMLNFIVQSAHSVDFIVSRIAQFIAKNLFEEAEADKGVMKKTFMEEESFKNNIEAVISSLKEAPKALGDLHGRFRSCIINRRYDFDRRHKMIKFLESDKMTPEYICDLVKRMLLESAWVVASVKPPKSAAKPIATSSGPTVKTPAESECKVVDAEAGEDEVVDPLPFTTLLKITDIAVDRSKTKEIAAKFTFYPYPQAE